jgi:hypothetical protein
MLCGLGCGLATDYQLMAEFTVKHVRSISHSLARVSIHAAAQI